MCSEINTDKHKLLCSTVIDLKLLMFGNEAVVDGRLTTFNKF